MYQGFHAHDGWYFQRIADGHVLITVAESAQADAPLLTSVAFDPDTWASIVASVSAGGETATSFHAARVAHQQAEV